MPRSTRSRVVLVLVSFITPNSPRRCRAPPSGLHRSPPRFQIPPLRIQIPPTSERPQRSRGPWKHLAGAGCLLALNAQPLDPQFPPLAAQEIVSRAQVGFSPAQVAFSRAQNPSRQPFLASRRPRKSSPERRLQSPRGRKPHCHQQIRQNARKPPAVGRLPSFRSPGRCDRVVLTVGLRETLSRSLVADGGSPPVVAVVRDLSPIRRRRVVSRDIRPTEHRVRLHP